MQSINGAALYDFVKPLLVHREADVHNLTSPAFSGSAGSSGKLGPCLSSYVDDLEVRHNTSALSFPLAVLCDDAALTLDFNLLRGPCWVFQNLESMI